MVELISSTELQMSLLLFFSLAGYLVASRINQSAVIGLIIIGILIGPSLLGLVTYTDFVKGLAHLGIVVLLFVIGLEFKLKDVINIKYGIIALTGAIIPWIAGYSLATLFGFEFATAVFVGTALTATSIAITANVLKEMGKLQTEVAKAIIGAAVIDDIISLIALSVSAQIISGTLSYTSILITFLKSAGFLFFGYYIGHNFLSRILIAIDNTKLARMYSELAFIFAMMIAFLYAALAEFIGSSAIIGAFIAGVSLGNIPLKHSKDYREGAEYLHIMFASIFFVSLGVLADLSHLTLSSVGFLLLLTIVAVLTKVIGCGISARLQGMSSNDSLIVGVGMAPRGEVAMIIALIGLNQNIFGQEIYVSLVIMSLLTTIITPIILRKLFLGSSSVKYSYKN